MIYQINCHVIVGVAQQPCSYTGRICVATWLPRSFLARNDKILQVSNPFN